MLKYIWDTVKYIFHIFETYFLYITDIFIESIRHKSIYYENRTN